ncbi:MAG: Rrf2 family transcriptional regulator [Planctomycetaceae bacterium]
MLSQTAEYALRAIVVLARAAPEPRTNQQLAELTQVPGAYLPKVMQSLRKAGLVRAQRGLGGGLRLARPADSITLLEAVNAVDPLLRILECPLRLKDHDGRLCALHRKIDETAALAERLLRETTLADMLNDIDGPAPLCQRSPEALVSLT